MPRDFVHGVQARLKRGFVALGVACSLLASTSAARAEAELSENQAVSISFESPIDEVRINGLWRTKPMVVTRELPWTVGAPLTAEQWELGLDRLWNLGIFSEVAARIDTVDGRRIAIFELEERFTIIPVIRFSAGGAGQWIQLGLYDINTLGRYLELGAVYERFGEYNGGQLWLRHPRILGRQLQGQIVIDRLNRPRPGFVLTRAQARLEVLSELHDRLRFGARLDLFSDRFSPFESAPLAETRALPPESGGLLLGGSVRFGLVDTVRLRNKNWSFELRPSIGLLDDPGYFGFGHVAAELLAFKMIGRRFNVALRLRGGAMTAAPPQHRFYLGGIDLVRGFRDNHLRAGQYVLYNLELRFIAFDSMLLALMPTLFSDGALANPDPGFPGHALSVGAGLRVLFPRLVGSGVRLDVAAPLEAPWKPILSVGGFHWF